MRTNKCTNTLSFEKGPSFQTFGAAPARTDVRLLRCVYCTHTLHQLTKYLSSAKQFRIIFAIISKVRPIRSCIFDHYFVGLSQNGKNKSFASSGSVMPLWTRNRCWCHHVASSPNGREDDESCQKIQSPSAEEAHVMFKCILSRKNCDCRMQ